MTNTTKCFQITVSGELRGRGLRFSAMYIAFSRNVKGFVEYTGTGGIMIEAEGEPKNLKQFIAGLRSLDQSWEASDFNITETTPKGYSSFEIHNRRDAEGTPVHKSYAGKQLLQMWLKMRLMFGSDKSQVL
jgi:acylphosphatase